MIDELWSCGLEAVTFGIREGATTIGAVMRCARVDAEGVSSGRALERAVHVPISVLYYV
jgi:hypothetical protein